MTALATSVNNTSELLAQRPRADPAIRMIFPMVLFRITSRIDKPRCNHMTITGSDTLGRLYRANAACDDWTAGPGGSKPRAGMSWPQSFGGGGFIWWNETLDLSCGLFRL